MTQSVVQDKVSPGVGRGASIGAATGVLKLEQMPMVNLEAPKRRVG